MRHKSILLRIFFSFDILILMSCQIFSQETNIKKHQSDTIFRPLNVLFFQCGGESLPMLSINYERTIYRGKIGSLAVRVGAGYGFSIWPLSFPLTIEQIFGKKHCGEIGFGINVMTGYGFIPLAFLGYRFRSKHFIFRWDIALVRDDDSEHFGPIPGTSLGVIF